MKKKNLIASLDKLNSMSEEMPMWEEVVKGSQTKRNKNAMLKQKKKKGK